MRFARTMMAFVLMLSVAMLPAAGSASIVTKSTEMAVSGNTDTGAEMSAVMDGCCPDHAKPCDQSSDQSSDQCQSMASCAFQSVSLADVAVSPLRYPPVPGNMLPRLTYQAVPLHSGSPPFRPPRV